ncbi:CV_2116 domain-containing protein [Acidihalobacter aeolianus]|uniref:CV_2116 domain-containing protein n=1 Tax=Acidihalobacter aeolianus TaxID=2792603 RepID=UPI0012EA298B
MDMREYKGYVIRPAPLKLTDSRCWSLNLYIMRHSGNDSRERNFSSADTYETREEAVAHCYVLGQQIIDGKSTACSVADL